MKKMLFLLTAVLMIASITVAQTSIEEQEIIDMKIISVMAVEYTEDYPRGIRVVRPCNFLARLDFKGGLITTYEDNVARFKVVFSDGKSDIEGYRLIAKGFEIETSKGVYVNIELRNDFTTTLRFSIIDETPITLEGLCLGVGQY